jgi:glucose-6-phosphate-specific signal transduction histidine kinase
MYAMLRHSQKGLPPSEEKITALIERVNEIIFQLSKELNSIEETLPALIPHDLEELDVFLDHAIQKIRKIYPDIKFLHNKHSHHHSSYRLLLNNEILYQALENAVENSQNAKASIVSISTIVEDQKIILEITDNGIGLMENLPDHSIEGTGIFIISENMRIMKGIINYKKPISRGLTLQLIFPLY